MARSRSALEAIGKCVASACDDAGTYWVIDLARLKEAMYVLHACQKKTRATSKQDIEITKCRFTELLADTPDQAADLLARADLARQIAELIEAEGRKQVEAAERFGVA